MFAASSMLSVLLSAITVAAAPGLLVQLSAPAAVHDVDNFRIVTTVINSGDETLHLLKHPDSLLSDLPTEHFTLANDHGVSPSFSGIRVTYATETSGNHTRFVTLAPGRSVDVEHDLSAAYEFSTSGPGKYMIKLKEFNTFFYAVGTEVKTLVSGSGQSVHAVTLSGSVQAVRRAHSFVPCTSAELNGIREAIPIANYYVNNALTELYRDGYNSRNYQRWFGAPDEARFRGVWSDYQQISKNRFDQYRYSCRAPLCPQYDTLIAYVYADIFGEVNLCPYYFNNLPTYGNSLSRASTLVHEASHFTYNGGAKDHGYGESLVQEMARTRPDLAVTNAANHEYYAINARGNNVRGAPAQQVLVAQEGLGDEYIEF